MRNGAILLYKIPKVVSGENRSFRGPEAYLVELGVELALPDDDERYQLMQDFIHANPALCREDIGESANPHHARAYGGALSATG